MKVIIYKNGTPVQRLTVQHLDVTHKTLCLYEVSSEERKLRDFVYAGTITFTLFSDILSIDLFEDSDHIRITAFGW